uniref:Small ubiquitin-related modifier n=1 Tax=Callorhinchus milii TaxID=7868 RepID=A0A4W3HTP9_CALMI
MVPLFRPFPCLLRGPSQDLPLRLWNDHINLKVAGQDGSVVQFKIKKHTPLSKLMKAYCERQGLQIRQIRFRFDGQPINETDTPAMLEMEDEDTIDVFQQQTGGTC